MMKVLGSLRLGKVKSEIDLFRKFDKYIVVDEYCYRDLWFLRIVNFVIMSCYFLVFGSIWFSLWDMNNIWLVDIEVLFFVIMNGYGLLRFDINFGFFYMFFWDMFLCELYSIRIIVLRYCIGFLGEESDMLDDLDYGVGYFIVI